MTMKWVKKGLIYAVTNNSDWAWSHTHKPTPYLVADDALRVFFGVRGRDGKTRTTFIDVDPDNPLDVKYIHDRPVLDLGRIGAFDDCGANVSSIVNVDGVLYMYFIGWNPSTTVHTRNSIGLAVSEDGGLTFERPYDGPVLDRNKDEPYYTGAVDVIREGDKFKMWYTSGTDWVMVDDKPEIRYHIKYAESDDGIEWNRPLISCIEPDIPMEATARPCVLREGDRYRMWYSRRQIDQFRTQSEKNYRAGYAESNDGRIWNRQDARVGIDVSPEGWDSEAIAYPYVYRLSNDLLMFYNGNGFGKSGFGYAVLEKDAN